VVLCPAVRGLPGDRGVTGAGVMLLAGGIPRGSLGTTGEVSQLIEELQYTLGEGPCVDACRQDQAVAEPDLADPVTCRWPAFTPPALRAGVRAVFGFPLRAGPVRVPLQNWGYGLELRLVSVGELGHDRGSCLSVCST
jgi:hypothetical protein